MTAPSGPPLEAVAAQLDQAVHDSGVQLLIGAAGLINVIMALLAWLGLRRQRDQVRAELAARSAIDVEPADVSPRARADDWPIACAGCGTVSDCSCVVVGTDDAGYPVIVDMADGDG